GEMMPGKRKLSEAELERVLEAGVRRGSVEAVKQLRALRRRQGRHIEEPEQEPVWGRERVWRWVLDGDPFVGLSPDELEMLSAEQREHAIAVTEAHYQRIAAERERRNGARP